MKKFIPLALVTLGVTVSARAQWIVYDPANTGQSVINTAQEIAKYIEMINQRERFVGQRNGSNEIFRKTKRRNQT